MVMIIGLALAHYVHMYIATGIALTLVSDVCIYYTKSSEQYTFLEIILYVLFWPVVLGMLLLSFFKKK